MNLGRVAGSMKNKVVASELQAERNKCAFDQKELMAYLHGGQQEFDLQIKWFNLLEKHPYDLGNHHHFFEMTRSEQ
jgi:hypothetical protein